MATAQVDLHDIVEATGVDPKTAQRWINGRAPNARHRLALVKLLLEDEVYLWPELLDGERVRAASKAELVALYAQRSDVPADLWMTLIRRAQHAIDILVYAALFLHEQNPRLNELLAEKAAAGCEIRVALGDPNGDCIKTRGEDEDFGNGIVSRCELALMHYGPLIGSERISVHQHDTTLYNSIYRFDDDMLVNTHVYAAVAYEVPVLHLRRLNGGAMFARYAASFDAVWEGSTPAIMDGG